MPLPSTHSFRALGNPLCKEELGGKRGWRGGQHTPGALQKVLPHMNNMLIIHASHLFFKKALKGLRNISFYSQVVRCIQDAFIEHLLYPGNNSGGL